MIRKYILQLLLAFAGIFISCHLQASSKIDTIYFQGGDRVTGEVKTLENNKIKLSTDDAGTIYVEWNNIDSVKILNTMRIVMDNGDIINGKILPAGGPGKAYIWSSEGDPQLVELAHIVILSPMKDRFLARLDGTLSSGFSYVKSTQVLQMSIDASVTYQAKKYQVGINYSGLFSEDPTSGYSQNQGGGASLIRLLPKNWFLLSILNFESNTELDLDLRSSITLGGGNSFIRTNKSNLYVALALQANNEISAGIEQNNLDAVLASKYEVFIYDDPEVTFTFSADLLPSLSDWGRVRTYIDSNMKWEIFDDFYLKWTFYYTYDSQPISEDAENSDWAVTLVGVEYKL